MDQLRYKRILKIVKLLFGLTLIGILLYSISVKDLFLILSRASGVWSLVTIVVAWILIDYQGWILGIVARPFARIPHFRLFAFTFIGRFFSLFLPSTIGGDVVKGLYLIPYFKRASDAYAAVFMHRMVSGLSTITVALLAALFVLPDNFRGTVGIIILVCILSACIMATVYFKFKRVLWRKGREYKQRKAGSRGVYKLIISITTSVLAYRRSPGAVCLAFVVSGLGTLLTAGLYMLVAITLGIPLSFSQAVMGASATLLSVILPLTPGGIGVSEGTFVVVSGMMGLPNEQALAIMVFGRIIGYIAVLPGGVFYLLMPRADKADVVV